MNRSLRRLLRIRELVEDRARLDLERKSAAMQALGQFATGQRQLARRIRADAVENLTGQETTAEWRMKIDDAEVIQQKGARLGTLAAAAKPAVDQARDELVEKRRELRQAEILHAAARREEERHQVRQDQNRTDDWFQSRPKSRTGRR